MAIVFFKSGGNTVSLDSETSITSSLTNSVTKSSTMSNSSSTDGYTVGNEVISVTGVVTSHKTATQSGNPSPSKFREYIESAISSGERFTVVFSFGSGDGETTTLLDSVDNCVITSRSYVVDKYLDTITVSLTFESQFVSVAATEVTLEAEKLEDTEKTHPSEGSSESGSKVSVTASDKTTLAWYLLGGGN